MYRTILQEGTDEFVEKNSRFIGYAKPVENEVEAKEYIDFLRQKYYDARHHCSAYILGEQAPIQRYDDDKEPSGTAGIPMLNVLKKENLTNVCVVVVRYFGGTLLGTGGLVRAYTQGCKVALQKAKIVEMKEYKKIELSYEYTYHGELEYFF